MVGLITSDLLPVVALGTDCPCANRWFDPWVAVVYVAYTTTGTHG